MPQAVCGFRFRFPACKGERLSLREIRERDKPDAPTNNRLVVALKVLTNIDSG